MHNISKRMLKDFYDSGKKDIVVVNIGSDKAIFDSIGPLVGSKIENKLKHIYSYGNLQYPIHALNLIDRVTEIENIHGDDTYYLAVDAAIGDTEEVLNIKYSQSPISPGKGVGKTIRSVGNSKLICIVDDSDARKDSFFKYKAVRLYDIDRKASEMAEIILEIDKKLYDETKEIG